MLGSDSWKRRYAEDGVGTAALLPIGAGRPKTTSSPARQAPSLGGHLLSLSAV